MTVLIVVLIAVAVLAVAWWAFQGRGSRTDAARAGSIWLHDPQGNIVPEDEEFKKPPDEGDLL